MDVMNAENAGAFFCPASPKAPTFGALPPASMQSFVVHLYDFS